MNLGGPPETLPAALADAARRWPEQTFLVDGDRRISYAAFDRLSAAVAARLVAAGYRFGDRLAIAAPNGVPWLAVWFGAARLGVVVVTLNVRYRAAEFDYMLTQSGARGLVCSARVGEHDFVAFFDELRADLPGVLDYWFLDTPAGDALIADPPPADGPSDSAPPGDTAPAPDRAPQGHDAAVILYTSGTTGQPKGATLTHRGILAAAWAQARHLGQDGDSIVGSMPLNHVGGLSCTIASTLVGGGTVVLLAAFSPGAVLELIETHRVQIFAGVPTMWVLMLGHPTCADRDLSSLRLAIVGGSNLEPTTAARITERLPDARLINLYGLSEVSDTAILSGMSDDLDTVTRTLGVVVDGYDWAVTDVDGHPTTSGELRLRGPALAAGYWQLPAETAATFDSDGWLHTGDIVDVEPDGRHLVFRSRLKEMFLQGGYNVYPVEVENVLGRHPAVVQAAGVGVPDPVLGEIGRYYVQRTVGTQVTGPELQDWCRTQLADYKIPRQIVFVDEFPLTPAGKIQKAALARD